MTEPYCVDCGGPIQVVGASYDGIKLGCDCRSLYRSIYVDWKSFHDAPMPWAYESTKHKPTLKHLGDHYGSPDPDNWSDDE